MSDTTPPAAYPAPPSEDKKPRMSTGKIATAGVGVALAGLIAVTQITRGAENEQDILDNLPGTITEVGNNGNRLSAVEETDDRQDQAISENRTGLALTPDQGQLNRRDEEQTARTDDLESDLDRENDSQDLVVSEVEADLENLEREFGADAAEQWRAIGRLEGQQELLAAQNLALHEALLRRDDG